MGFLAKLKNRIHHFQNKDFRKNIKESKKKTYLFRDSEETFSTSRVSFLRKKKNIIAPFSRMYQRLETLRDNNHHILNTVGGVLILLTVYILFFSSYFQITPSRVMIEPVDSSIDVNISHQAIDSLYGKSIFNLNKWLILASLRKYQKHISSIELDYLYPNNIKILLHALPIDFRVSIYGIDKSWGLTSNGVLIPAQKSGSGIENKKQLEVISPRLRETVFLDYKNIMAEEIVATIKKTLAIIESDFSDFRLAKSRYLENEQEFHITLESGVRIFLTLDNTLKNQLLSLKTYAQSNRDVFLKWETIYVDARIVGKIFVCSDKVLCKQNMDTIYGPIYE